jgi:hypothetical protein
MCDCRRWWRSPMRARASHSLAERASHLTASALADKRVPLAFYSRDTISSEAARARWIEPDRAPLDIDRVR